MIIAMKSPGKQPLAEVTAASTGSARARIAHARIVGGGEMAEAVRRHDWSETPLGPIEGWSTNLVDNVNLVLNSSAALALYWGPEMIYIGNDRTVELLKSGLADSLGLTAQELWGESWEKVKDRFEAVLTRRESFHYQNVPMCFEGQGKPAEIFINYSLSPVHHDGKIVGIFRAVEETTETVLALRALAESNERLRMALSAGSGFGVWDWHIQSGLVYGDERMAQLFGLDPQRAVAGVSHQEYERMVHPDDLQRMADAVMGCLLKHENYRVEYRVRRADGSYGWVRAMGQCVLDAAGHPYRVTGLKTAIDEPAEVSPAVSAAQPFSGEPWSALPASIRSFLAGTVFLLTDRPDTVQLEVIAGPMSTRLLLHAPASDLGKIIGKQGRIMRSLRTVLLGISGTSGQRFSIDVMAREQPAVEAN